MSRRAVLRNGLAGALVAATVSVATPVAAAPTHPGTAVQAPAAGTTVGRGRQTFESLDVEDLPVRGAHAVAEAFFPLRPGERAAGPAAVELVVSHSPLLLPERSTVTVAVNGRSLTSERLTPENADRGRVRAVVPPEALTGGGVFLEVRFSLRLTRDACEDTVNPALWATVHGTSTIDLTTSAVDRSLADLPGLLGSPVAGEALTVVTPADAAPPVRAAAAAAATQVGRWAAARQRDPVLEASVTLPAASPALLVGTGAQVTAEGLPVRWDGTSFSAAAGPVARDAGVVAVAPAGPPRVLVSGADDAAVARAVGGLTAGAAAIQGPVAAVSGASPPLPARGALPWEEGAASFEQLGVGRRDLTGPGVRTLDLTFDRPAGWDVAEGAHLDLVLDAGTGLGGTASVQVSVNGANVGTRRLRPGAGPTTERFALPSGLVDADGAGRPERRLVTRLTFLLDPDRQACTPFEPESARVSVLPTSTWSLPHRWHRGHDLGRFPYRLHDGQGRRAVVVLPDGADAATTSAAYQLAAAIGRWAEPGTEDVEIAVASQLSREQRAGRELVLLGDADRQLGAAMDLGRSALVTEPGQVVAVLGQGASPLGRGRTALGIHGDGAALLLAARALASAGTLTRLSGSRAALVGPAPTVPAPADGGATGAVSGQTLRRGPEAAAAPEVAPVAGIARSRTPFIVGAVTLVAFLAILGLGAWYRWVRHRRRAA